VLVNVDVAVVAGGAGELFLQYAIEVPQYDHLEQQSPVFAQIPFPFTPPPQGIDDTGGVGVLLGPEDVVLVVVVGGAVVLLALVDVVVIAEEAVVGLAVVLDVTVASVDVVGISVVVVVG
jgi:hypothetical protein